MNKLILVLILLFSPCLNASANYLEKIDNLVENRGISYEKVLFLLQKSDEKLKKNPLFSELINYLERKTRNSDMYILKFGRYFSDEKILLDIENSKEIIAERDNVFLFRYKENLTNHQIKLITSRLKELNSNVRIFIDQEGGIIRRFEDFEGGFNENIFKENLKLFDIYSSLSDRVKSKIKANFAKQKYFISMKQIGNIYYSLPLNERDSFLKFIAYFKIYSLERVGINTHGLILDLDYGNPVISGYYRSFSGNYDDYLKLSKYFVDASKYYNVSLYLKHFPGHGFGHVDTHKGILKYNSDADDYLTINLELFNEVKKYAKSKYTEIGYMVGHIILQNDFRDKFLDSIIGVDYLITDDLDMAGYKYYKPELRHFLSTKEIVDLENTILVDSQSARIK